MQTMGKWMKMHSWRGVLVMLLTCTLAATPLALSACQTSREDTEVAETDTTEPAEDATEAEDATTDDESEEEELSWQDFCEEHDLNAGSCLDRNGDPTAYALWMLPGDYLDALLEGQGYVWSTRDLMWIKGDGSVALLVVDGAGDPVSRDEIQGSCPAMISEGDNTFAQLGWRVVTSKFSTPKKAFEAVVSKACAASDVEYVDKGGVGLFQTVAVPAATEVTESSEATEDTVDSNLVFISTNNDTIVVSLFSKQAVENGVFTQVAGRDLGTSPEAAFEALAGRAPAL